MRRQRLLRRGSRSGGTGHPTECLPVRPFRSAADDGRHRRGDDQSRRRAARSAERLRRREWRSLSARSHVRHFAWRRRVFHSGGQTILSVRTGKIACPPRFRASVGSRIRCRGDEADVQGRPGAGQRRQLLRGDARVRRIRRGASRGNGRHRRVDDARSYVRLRARARSQSS